MHAADCKEGTMKQINDGDDSGARKGNQSVVGILDMYY